MPSENFHLGIDLGSISLKIVLLDASRHVRFEQWLRVQGSPLHVLADALTTCAKQFPKAMIHSLGVCGSGRSLISKMLGAHEINEISAHAKASTVLFPQIRTIIEIGGQDSKLIILQEDHPGGPLDVQDFRMNELCAAGTGAFLDQQAARLGLSIETFSRLGRNAKHPAPIAGRCAVFAKTDMTHHQQEGRSLSDIIAGLNEALVRSYLANLVRGKPLPRPIAFQGGVAANEGLMTAFKRLLDLRDEDCLISRHAKTMGAIGAALIAAESPGEKSSKALPEFAQQCRALLEQQDRRSLPSEERGLPLFPPSRGATDPDWSRVSYEGYALGIDVGSVSVKAVLLGPKGVAFSDYRFSDGKPMEALREILTTMQQRTRDLPIQSIGVTGSGRHFVGKLIDADIVQNEITAQATAASFLAPGVDTVIEIGGQDAKFLRLQEGRALHFAMNRVCAAGTGAFLQEQAARLDIDLERSFSEMAFASERPAMLGARCTVFMESDLVSHQQQGFAKRDLIAGLATSVVTNYLEKVVAGHPIGKRVLFLGGVALNRAVVSALEARIGKPVATSTVGHLSGAIGAALAAHATSCSGAMRQRDCGVEPAVMDFDQAPCEACSNRCIITSTKGASPRHFGGRCGKWEGAPSECRHSIATSSPLKRRQRLFEEGQHSDEGREPDEQKPRIGIPRALLTFDLLPAWSTFFQELGCDVVLSPPTDDAMLSEGQKHLVVETCLPVKAFCSHLRWLEAEGVDFIFAPSFVYTSRDAHGKETAHCPYIQSLTSLAKPIVTTPLLAPLINWKLDPKSEARAMAALAPILGRSRRQGRRAWHRSEEKLRALRCELNAIGTEVLDSLTRKKPERAFLLLGKDYNVNDAKISSNISGLLEARGELVITQDMIADDSGSYSPAYRTMFWSHGKEMLAAAEIAAQTPGLFPILITSFGCGPDSFTTRFVRDILGEKPLLILEVDEHSSSVGMETRIEAFLDALPMAISSPAQLPRPRFSPRGEVKRVFLPNFSDHGIAFAAAISHLGFTPVLTAMPDDASAELGAQHASSGECHPYVLMLGDYLKVAQSGEDFSDACYFMPESGACRVAQFGAQMRLVGEELGLSLPIFTRIEDLAETTRGIPRAEYVKAISMYWKMMRGLDFLVQSHLEQRAYEEVPGSADRAQEEARAILWHALDRGKLMEGLAQAQATIMRVKADRRQPRVRIGITGDYFTRVCDYANSDLFREIERLGGVVMLPPTISEFVKYESYQRIGAALRHRNVGDLLQGIALRSIINPMEKEVRKLFGGELDYDIPLEYHRARKLLAPYMDIRLPPGITGSVVSVLEQIRAGADGIINAITFHCTYGLAISSALSLIDRDEPDVPKLTMIFEGLKPTHNRMRLEAFMDRVHAASRRKATKDAGRP